MTAQFESIYLGLGSQAGSTSIVLVPHDEARRRLTSCVVAHRAANRAEWPRVEELGRDGERDDHSELRYQVDPVDAVSSRLLCLALGTRWRAQVCEGARRRKDCVQKMCLEPRLRFQYRLSFSGQPLSHSDARDSELQADRHVPRSVARNFQLRIGTHKTRITFDGFLKDDFERLQNLCKQVRFVSASFCSFGL